MNTIIKIILPLLFLFVFSGADASEECMGGCFPHLENNDMVLGTIQSVDRNSIEIFDEYDKTIKSFVYLEHPSLYGRGERVRIYFDPNSKRVRIIKKMTMLDYSKNGQNLGYIIKN